MSADEIAPVFDELSVSPDSLWPANHKYVDVTATVVVSDNFDLGPDHHIELGCFERTGRWTG